MTQASTRFSSPGQRLFATALDLLLCTTAVSLLRAIWPADNGVTLPAGLVLASAALVTAYFSLFWSTLGATPGMLLAGNRLLNAGDMTAPGIAQSLLRLFAWLAAALPLGLGLALMFRDGRRQGLHDKIARTLVVEDDESVKSLDQLLREAR